MKVSHLLTLAIATAAFAVSSIVVAAPPVKKDTKPEKPAVAAKKVVKKTDAKTVKHTKKPGKTAGANKVTQVTKATDAKVKTTVKTTAKTKHTKAAAPKKTTATPAGAKK